MRDDSDQPSEQRDGLEPRSSDGQLTLRFSDYGIIRRQLNYHHADEPEPRFLCPPDISQSTR